MQKEIKFDNKHEFMTTLRENEISRLAFSEINERRAEQTKEDMLEVIVKREVDVLAYYDSIIYKYRESGEGLDALHDELVSEGFQITKISRNIT